MNTPNEVRMLVDDARTNKAANLVLEEWYNDISEHYSFIAYQKGYDAGKPKWIDVEKELPKEGGRYWCFCTEQTELGKSFFQWNCYYDPSEKEFRDDHKKVYVTHWTYLLDWPKYDTL